MKWLYAVPLFTAAVFASSSQAAGNAAAGKQKATACAGCHGQDGHSPMPTYPNLAGQNEQYLMKALEAYKAGHRTGGQAAIMLAQASQLSDQDIADLAAYFHSLPAGQ